MTLYDGWSSRLRACKDAVVWRVLPFLLRQPSVTSKLVQETMQVTQPAADNALRQLEEAGALSKQKSVHGERQKRNVVWQATEVLEALDRFANVRAGNLQPVDQKTIRPRRTVPAVVR